MRHLSGQRFGKLVVQGRAPSKQKPCGGKVGMWTVLCDCGASKLATTSQLTGGIISSCGCIRIRHGHARNGIRSSTYNVWQNMRERCGDPYSVAYEYYGVRGIVVCERWNSFENFLADMGERPPGLSLDRINNNGNYEPGNCRWATNAEQAANRRGTLSPPLINEALGRYEHKEPIFSIARRLGVSSTHLYRVIRQALSKERMEASCA